jgi:hypothetical protein
MLIDGILNSWRPTPTPSPTPSSTGTGTNAGGNATPTGDTSQTTPTAPPTATTAPAEPPRSGQAVQPTTAAPTSGSSTSGPGGQPASAEPEPVYTAQPRGGADALRRFRGQITSGEFRPDEPKGTIEAEVRRIETLEVTQITRAELIKQASVALLAQANLRQKDVLDILAA